MIETPAIYGVAVAYAAGRLASSWLYEVQASDPVILLSALGLVLGIAFLATVLPARRAARLEPARALRTGVVLPAVDTGLHALGWTRQQAIDYMPARRGGP